jgi:hypothetical protein
VDLVDRVTEEPDVLAETVANLEGDPLSWAGLVFTLGVIWGQDHDPDLPRLSRLISAMSLAGALVPDGHPGRRRAIVMVARYLTLRGRATGHGDDLERALAILHEVLAATPPGDPDLRFLRSLRVDALLARLETDPSVAVRMALAALLTEALPDDPTLGPIAELVARPGPDLALLTTEQALALARLDVAAHPPGTAGRPAALLSLATALSRRAGDQRSVADNSSAIAVGEELIELSTGVPKAEALHGIALMLQGRYQQQRYELTGDPVANQAAVELGTAAVDRLPESHPVHAISLANLGVFLLAQFEREGTQALLDEAARTLRGALDEEVSGPDRGRALSVLGAVHQARFREYRTVADLDEAVDLARRAVDESAPDDPSIADWLGNLCNALRLRYIQFGVPDDIHAAVDAARQAFERTPLQHADRSRAGQNLAGALLERYEKLGDPDDLDAALTVARDAAARAAPGMMTAAADSLLGNALVHRYEGQGDPADLDVAVDALRRAVQGMPDSSTDWRAAGGNLVSALSRRAELTGSSDDLDQAVTASRTVLARAPESSLEGVSVRLNLALVLSRRFIVTGRRNDLDEAIGLLRAAEPLAGAAERPSVFMNLASALASRHERFHDADDLDEALDAVRSALHHASPASPRRARYQAALAGLLTSRAWDENTGTARGDGTPGRRADLDAAIDAARASLEATSAQAPERAGRQYALGTALLLRAGLTSVDDRPPAETTSSDDRDEARRLARDAAALAAAPAPVRIQAASRWASLALEAGDHAEALQGLEVQLDLLPLVAWRGLRRADQERRLATTSGLARDAAAVALEVRRPEQAVELLEQGRAILWSQMLDSWGDLKALEEIRPDLAERLDQVRAALDRNADLDPFGAPTLGDVGPPETDRTRLAREWDRIVAEAQTLPGLQDFLRPRRFADLSRATAAGPVIVINVSTIRCDALIVTPGDVRVVPLPGLTARAVVDHLNHLYETFARPPSRLGDVVRQQQLVKTILGWLWATTARPVLEALEGAERVWWCPTGYLALLPLHAATDPDTGESVMDRVVSSYTSTLRDLARGGSAPLPAGPRSTAAGPDALVVAVPQTPGAPDLAVLPEVQAIVERLGPRCTVLLGPMATLDQVQENLPRHRWLHFACHGVQDLRHPSQSALLLSDGRPLSVLHLARLGLADVELAVLSACQTAGGGAVLDDEAIHLAAALHATGSRHVVATLWPLHDAVAPEVTATLYEGLATSGPKDAGLRLHTAVQKLRTGRARDLPALWAPYVHIGP